MKKYYLIVLGISVICGVTPAYSAAGAIACLTGDAATPGPVHGQLMKRAGEYTTVTKFSMQPGGQSSESTGTAKLSVFWMAAF